LTSSCRAHWQKSSSVTRCAPSRVNGGPASRIGNFSARRFPLDEVFVTYDSNLEFQQHLTDFAIGFVVLQAPSDDFDDLLPLVPGILEAISAVEPGHVAHVAA
jgi:hypothetical protein